MNTKVINRVLSILYPLLILTALFFAGTSVNIAELSQVSMPHYNDVAKYSIGAGNNKKFIHSLD